MMVMMVMVMVTVNQMVEFYIQAGVFSKPLTAKHEEQREKEAKEEKERENDQVFLFFSKVMLYLCIIL